MKTKEVDRVEVYPSNAMIFIDGDAFRIDIGSDDLCDFTYRENIESIAEEIGMSIYDMEMDAQFFTLLGIICNRSSDRE